MYQLCVLLCSGFLCFTTIHDDDEDDDDVDDDDCDNDDDYCDDDDDFVVVVVVGGKCYVTFLQRYVFVSQTRILYADIESIFVSR